LVTAGRDAVLLPIHAAISGDSLQGDVNVQGVGSQHKGQKDNWLQ
jgi:hypothetical protein